MAARLRVLNEQVARLRARPVRRSFLPPATLEEVSDLEATLGVEVPASYRGFLLAVSRGERDSGDHCILPLEAVRMHADETAPGEFPVSQNEAQELLAESGAIARAAGGCLALADLGDDVYDVVALRGPLVVSMWQLHDGGLTPHRGRGRGAPKLLDVLGWLEARVAEALDTLPPIPSPGTGELDWRGLGMRTLPPDLLAASRLQVLNLYGNELSGLPEALGALTELRVLVGRIRT